MSLHFHDSLFADFSFAQGKSMLFNGAEQKHARVDVHDQLLSNLWRAHASPVAGTRVFQHLPVAGGVGQSRAL